jgi:hypothetical protein
MTTGVADRRTAVFFLAGKGSGRNPREYLNEAARVTAEQASAHEGLTWS